MKIRATVEPNELIKVHITDRGLAARGFHTLTLFFLNEHEAGTLVRELQRALVDLSGEAPF